MPNSLELTAAVVVAYVENNRLAGEDLPDLTRLGLTPAQYREKWGLRPDYPMVAPNYSAARSALAKASGLGAQRRKPKAGPKASKARGGRGA